MTEQELDKRVKAELADWAAYVLLVLARKLAQKKLVLTGELLRSLQYEVVQSSTIPKAIIGFEDSGRIRDMRKLRYTQLPPIQVIEDYIRKIGLGNFKRVPGYRGSSPITQNKAINRIAWGIAISIRRENSVRRKPWFNRAFYSQIDQLIEDLSAIHQQSTGEAITESFGNG